MMKNFQDKSIFMQVSCWGENLCGPFLGASVIPLSVAYFVGFLRSGRIRPDQFCNLLALLWCTYWALNRNKKASPTETKAQRRRRDCQTLLSLWCLCFVVIIALFKICICVYGCHVSIINYSSFIQLPKWLINTC